MLRVGTFRSYVSKRTIFCDRPQLGLRYCSCCHPCPPGVHPVVDERVEHGVGHGEPVEAEVDVLDVGLASDLGVMVRVDEVHVVRQPAHREDDHHHHEHLHHLRIRKMKGKFD